MKKILIASMALGATLSVAAVSNAQIASSLHNFSAWAGGEICLPCHTPHNARGSYADAGPLWNHQLSAVASYTLYTSPTFNGAATATQPASSSKACLSCHDGTVALDAFGYNSDGSMKTTGVVSIAASASLGSDLSNDHPISFNYVTAQGLDNEIRVSTSPSGVTGGTTIAADMLFAGMMECASCHDVHNKYGITSLLKRSNAGSLLCLTCHIK